MKIVNHYFLLALLCSPFIFSSDPESGCTGRAGGGGRMPSSHEYNPDARRSRGHTTEVLESELDAALRHTERKPQTLLFVDRHLNPGEPIIPLAEIQHHFQYAKSTNNSTLLPGVDIDPAGNLLHTHQDPKPREVVRAHFLSDDTHTPPCDFATELKDDTSVSLAQKVINTFCGADMRQRASVTRSGLLTPYTQDRPVHIDVRPKQKEITAHNLLAAIEDTIERIQYFAKPENFALIFAKETGATQAIAELTTKQTEAYNELFTLLQWYSKAHKELYNAGICHIWKEKHKERLMHICEYIGRHLIEAPLKEHLQLKTKDDNGAAIISVVSHFLLHARLLEVIGKHVHTSDISEPHKTNMAEYKETISIARSIVQKFYEDQKAEIARLKKEQDDLEKAEIFYRLSSQRKFLNRLHNKVLEKKAIIFSESKSKIRTVSELKLSFAQWRTALQIQRAEQAAEQAQAAMQLEDATKTGNAIHAISSFIALVRNPQTIRDASRAFDRWIESIVTPRLHTRTHDADPVRAPGLDDTDSSLPGRAFAASGGGHATDKDTIWESAEEETEEEDKQ